MRWRHGCLPPPNPQKSNPCALCSAEAVQRGVADATEDIGTEIGRQRLAPQELLKSLVDCIFRRLPMAGDRNCIGVELLAIFDIKGPKRFVDRRAHAGGIVVFNWRCNLSTHRGCGFVQRQARILTPLWGFRDGKYRMDLVPDSHMDAVLDPSIAQTRPFRWICPAAGRPDSARNPKQNTGSRRMARD